MNLECCLRPGQIVRSKAGRDRGDVFVVFEILDAKHVSVVDGRRRPLERPKRKRVLHLQPANKIVEDFETMKAEQSLNDARIRAMLRPYTGGEEEAQHVE